MNQDFTEKKKQYLFEKKFVQRVSPEKKNSCTSSEQKENNLKIPPSPPPHHFSYGPSLSLPFVVLFLFSLRLKKTPS